MAVTSTRRIELPRIIILYVLSSASFLANLSSWVGMTTDPGRCQPSRSFFGRHASTWSDTYFCHVNMRCIHIYRYSTRDIVWLHGIISCPHWGPVMTFVPVLRVWWYRFRRIEPTGGLAPKETIGHQRKRYICCTCNCSLLKYPTNPILQS